MKDKEQTTIRLTIRLSDGLERLIKKESVRRGTNMNQTMLYILNRYFKFQK